MYHDLSWVSGILIELSVKTLIKIISIHCTSILLSSSLALLINAAKKKKKKKKKKDNSK